MLRIGEISKPPVQGYEKWASAPLQSREERMTMPDKARLSDAAPIRIESRGFRLTTSATFLYRHYKTGNVASTEYVLEVPTGK